MMRIRLPMQYTSEGVPFVIHWNDGPVECLGSGECHGFLEVSFLLLLCPRSYAPPCWEELNHEREQGREALRRLLSAVMVADGAALFGLFPVTHDLLINLDAPG